MQWEGCGRGRPGRGGGGAGPARPARMDNDGGLSFLVGLFRKCPALAENKKTKLQINESIHEHRLFGKSCTSVVSDDETNRLFAVVAKIEFQRISTKLTGARRCYAIRAEPRSRRSPRPAPLSNRVDIFRTSRSFCRRCWLFFPCGDPPTFWWRAVGGHQL